MPPKKRNLISKARRSRTSVPQLLPLYQLLTNSEDDYAATHAISKLEAVYKQHDSAIEKNIFYFILRVCGLSQIGSKIEWREPIQSLKEALQSCFEKKTNISANEDFYLINTKSKFHKPFMERVRTFLSDIINFQTPYAAETEILKLMFDELFYLSKCSYRNVRCSAMEVIKIIVSLQIQYYQKSMADNSKKKGMKVLTILEEGYIKEILRQRLKDFDNGVRERSFQILQHMMIQLSQELINEYFLNKIIGTILNQNFAQPLVVAVLKLLESILKIKDGSQKLKKEIETFFSAILKYLEEIALGMDKKGLYSMKILRKLKLNYQQVDCLKPTIVSRVVQNAASSKSREGLKTAISLFYQSLFAYDSTSELIEKREFIIPQIVHLLNSIDNRNVYPFIMEEFFKYERQVFSFQEMFILLMSEYYNREGHDIEFTIPQLSALLRIILEFNKFVRRAAKSEWKQREEEEYNKIVLTSCKEIFYDKITQHEHISHLYLQLYGQIYFPITGSLENYAQFIVGRIIKIITNEQFDNTGENLSVTTTVLRNCVKIYEKFTVHKLEPLFQSFKINDLAYKNPLDPIDIVKMLVLLQKHGIEELLENRVFVRVIEAYRFSQDEKLKETILMLAYKYFSYILKEILRDPNEMSIEQYFYYRNSIFQLIFEKILENPSQSASLKFMAFQLLSQILKEISSDQFRQFDLYYQLSDVELTSIYKYVETQIPLNQSMSILDITNLLNSMDLSAKEEKEGVLKSLFSLFHKSFAILINKYTVEFIVSILLNPNLKSTNYINYINEILCKLAKDQIKNANSNSFVFWRFFHEIVQCVDARKPEEVKPIMNYLIKEYFKINRNEEISTKLKEKLGIYITDFIDKIVKEEEYEKFSRVIYFVSKVSRRIPKQMIYRIYYFYKTKLEDVKDKNVEELLAYLKKVSKPKKKKKVEKEESESSSSSGSQESSESGESGKEEEERKGKIEDGKQKLSKTRGQTKKRHSE